MAPRAESRFGPRSAPSWLGGSPSRRTSVTIPVAVSNPTDTGLEDLESSLDGALAARMPHYRLTGHYRSRHESLICFSNHACYGGELVTYRRAAAAAAAVSSD